MISWCEGISLPMRRCRRRCSICTILPDLSDEAVWEHMNQPLKSGGPYMTEYCSGETEWQSIGFNCFAVSMLRCGSFYSVGQATNMKDDGSIVGLTRATNLESVCL